MTTALDMIKGAMRIAGVLGQNETPTSSEADDGLVMLNAMLALWANDRTFAYTVTTNTFPLTNGVASYTVGTGGTFNMTRPITIDYAYIRLNNVDFPLEKINNQDYGSIAYKANQGFPTNYYYDGNSPLATLYIYGVPTTGMSIFFDTWVQLTQFTTLATDLTFPPGYEACIRYNLAKFICSEYGMSLTPEATELAVTTLAMVRERNIPSLVMKTEVGYITRDPLFGYGPWSY